MNATTFQSLCFQLENQYGLKHPEERVSLKKLECFFIQ